MILLNKPVSFLKFDAEFSQASIYPLRVMKIDYELHIVIEDFLIS